MKVFISWSKPASRKVGVALRDWLPEVIQQIKPWMSSEDIEKGQRWAARIGETLNETGQGILCVTSQNLHEPWLNFEAGALAKSLDDSRVRPILLGLQASDVAGPLAQFQATLANDHDDMLKLIGSLNESCETPLDKSRLERAFERTWRDFAKKVEAAMTATVPQAAPAHRSVEEMVGEVLERVREIQRSSVRTEIRATEAIGRLSRSEVSLLRDRQPDLSARTRADLMAIAEDIGASGLDRMRKAELIEAIRHRLDTHAIRNIEHFIPAPPPS